MERGALRVAAKLSKRQPAVTVADQRAAPRAWLTDRSLPVVFWNADQGAPARTEPLHVRINVCPTGHGRGASANASVLSSTRVPASIGFHASSLAGRGGGIQRLTRRRTLANSSTLRMS